VVNEERVVLEFTGTQTQRLDKFLVACLPEYSRSRLQALIKSGRVQVGGAPAEKSGQILESRVVIEVYIPAPEPADLLPESIPLDIIFENPDLVVVNKPAGMVVHPSAGHHQGTLVQAVLAHAPDIAGVGGKLRPGVVHRLDKDTSGLIVFAKNDRAHRRLQDQFRLRKVKKMYFALVDGKPPTPVGRIEAAIGRDLHDRNLMAVVPANKGREAVSEYRTLEEFAAHTLVEIYPQTGRTHQIRVHLRFIGCPVAGDTVYGRKKSSLVELKRHFLHAARLEILLPGETEPRRFKAPLPADLKRVLHQLRV
jgi:23S rRNA pseudouridine1911/1915/1917 synthase